MTAPLFVTVGSVGFPDHISEAGALLEKYIRIFFFKWSGGIKPTLVVGEGAVGQKQKILYLFSIPGVTKLTLMLFIGGVNWSNLLVPLK